MQNDDKTESSKTYGHLITDSPNNHHSITVKEKTNQSENYKY
jgi:hypothetical protein